MSKVLSEFKTEFGMKNTVPLDANGRTTLSPSKAVVDRSIKPMFEATEAADNTRRDDVEDPITKSEFDAALRRVSAKLDGMAARARQAREEGRTTPFPK